MEQPTENKTPVDAGVAQESGEITEAHLRDVLAVWDGHKPAPQPVQEIASEEPKAQTQVAAGDSGEAEKSEIKQGDSDPQGADKAKSPEQETSTKEKGVASEPAAKEKPDKQAKEQARLADSWKRLEEEKAAVRKQAEELRLAKERAEDEAIKSVAPNQQYTPEQYRKFASQWENEGRDDLAKQARIMADSLEKAQSLIKDRNERKERELNEIRQSNARRVIDENPELKDQGSQLYKTLSEIANSEDEGIRNFLNTHPNGLIYAAQIAKMKVAAESAATLKTEVEKLKAENEQFRKRLSVGESTPSKPSKGKKSFDQMDSKEQEQFLSKLVREADEGVLLGV